MCVVKRRMNRSSLRADGLMLLAAAIWGSTFVAQRLGMDVVGPFLYTASRFLLGALLLTPLALQRRAHPPGVADSSRRSLWLAGLVLGAVVSFAINFQQVGLQSTSVTNAAFITGSYVVLVLLIGWVLKHQAGAGVWLGTGLTVVGMYFLSVTDQLTLSYGDGLQMVSAAVWAVHVLLVGYYARRHDALQLACIQFWVCGLLSLLVALWREPVSLGALWQAKYAIAYGGALSVGLGYTLQMVAQRHAIPSHAAIIFSMEGVFGALAGWWVLGERLTGRGWLGCGLMLAGMLTAQLWPRKAAGPEADLPRH